MQTTGTDRKGDSLACKRRAEAPAKTTSRLARDAPEKASMWKWLLAWWATRRRSMMVVAIGVNIGAPCPHLVCQPFQADTSGWKG
jgi:hypothetical protein